MESCIPDIDLNKYGDKLSEAIVFHGHLCPGLLIGYRAAILSMEMLQSSRSEDEELFVIVENDSCAADAIQYITGCTFGKGNFRFLDFGKHVYTLVSRTKNRAVRISYAPKFISFDSDNDDRNEKIKYLLDADCDELFDISEVDADIPDMAKIYESVRCASCNESTMSSRIIVYDGIDLCIPCYYKKKRMNI